MLKKFALVTLALFILFGSTLAFAADDDVPRPKSVELPLDNSTTEKTK